MGLKWLVVLVLGLVSVACSEPGNPAADIETSGRPLDQGAAAASVPAAVHSAGTGARSATTGLPFYSDPAFTPHWLSPTAPALDTFHKIPPFQLIDQDGARITEQTFHKKIYIASFFFTTCPGICPLMTRNMRKLQDEFMEDDDVLLLSHSVTPDRDDVVTLKRYAELHGVRSDKWHLVTGERGDIYRLGRKFYFVEEDLGIDADDNKFLHTENFVLIDQQRHIRGIYNGLNKASLQQLVKDVRYLQG